MRKALIATSALAFAGAVAAVPASAADMLSLGVGGYMENWVGYSNRDDKGVDGGFDVQQDAEIHFSGSLESDSGLKFSVHVELEAANEVGEGHGSTNPQDDTEIDESFVRMSGEFGTIEIGQRDPIHARTHYAAGFGAGIGINAGDTQNWVPGVYLETAGWTIPGDNRNIIYITPRVNGVQVGLSYGPDSKNENSAGGAPSNNDESVVAAGINFNETIGDMSIKVSLGHVNVSNTGSVTFDLDQDNGSDRNASLEAMDDVTKGFDDKTFTNAGLQVGMGAFTFGVSYATRDDGGYMSQCYWASSTDVAAVAAVAEADPSTDAAPALPAITEGDMIPCDGINTRYTSGQTLVFQGSSGASGAETAVADADANARHMIVEDESGQSDTWAVGISYSDGPMTVSIDHVSHERENGDERTATGFSAGYKLAPGVDWKSSIIGIEDDTKDSEGTIFVTGLDIHF